MTDLAAVESDAVAGRLVSKDSVDRPQHRLGRAERDFQRHHAPFLPGVADAPFEIFTHRQECSRIRALKAVDRLLGVAHGKDRAQAVANALTGEKLLGEGRHDLPLLGVGVLCLVDQNVVEAAVQLEEHPWRDAGPAQQIEGGRDQVVIVEHPLGALGGCIRIHQRTAQTDQRAARLDKHGRRSPLAEFFDPFSLSAKHRRSVAAGAAGGLPSDQDFAGLALVGQKCRDIRRKHLTATLRSLAPFPKDSAPVSIGAGSGGERRCSRAQAPLVSSPRGAETCDDCLLGRPGGQSQSSAELVEQLRMAFAEHIPELAALGRQRRHQHTKAFLGSMASYHCKRVGELGLVSVASGNHHTLAGLDQRFARAALVENSKFGRHSRLQREAAQQGLAEGVDRRDFDAAGGFENAREKLSGPGDCRIARHLAG